VVDRLKAGHPLTPPSLLGEGYKRAVAKVSPLWGETFRNAAILARKADTDRATAAALQDT